ncbi:phosphoribosyltransferase [Prauserella sp. PE36]|uniref:Phosphoribosyltransferase n=1 Tax=Prauserella endophytica TaxID=1592324 RepID=A0ABY2RXS5_9PSEU|nr:MULTISPECIES: phosphoribosyltransferase family protein [Prauserella]RBM16717.1 phosphoribosyltransferase [Prauserella sp. PE36]TKG64862.1 phosphoribosyltransferase [Prauserella endophytica]
MRQPATTSQTYTDRRDAGRRLAGLLSERDWVEPVVLGLARGGVPVAAEVAAELDAPLGVAVARKIGAPEHPEFGIGAVTAHGPATFDDRSVRALGLGPGDLEEACERERAEAQRRVDLYLQGREPERAEGRDVLLIDDGLATGVTATAALRALRADGPRRLILATPVCAAEAAEGLRAEADEVVCALRPEGFRAVGQWYDDFGQTTDDEVLDLLAKGA